MQKLNQIVILFLVFIVITLCHRPAHTGALSNAHKVMQNSIKAGHARTLIATENMANAHSAGYVPKTIYLAPYHNRRQGITTVKVKRIQRNSRQMRQDYQPNHPRADEKGYVMMPDINPMISMVDMREAQQGIERNYKVYQIITDLRYKTLNMISSH